MVNDLSTLNGSLVEMKDQLIYELGEKGVTASYDSTTGLLGLIGKISDIQQGGSCYHIELNESAYTTTGSLTVTATLQNQYQPYANQIVTFTGGTSTVTATTDSNGVATATVTFSASGTLTASYSNVSDTATVTVASYIINDDASVDHSSTLFASSVSLRSNGTASVSYNSSHYYVITNTTNAAEALIEFKPLYGITSSFKVTIRSKGTTTNRCPICLYYYKDNNNWGGLKTETDYTYYSDKTNGTYSEHQTTGTTGLNKNDECIVEFIYDSSLNKMTMNVYDTSMVLKKSINMNVPITLPSSVKWGTTTTWARNTSRNLYEIKAEYL